MGLDPRDRLGDEQLVTGRHERNAHADLVGQQARPRPRRVDHHRALDRPLRGLNAPDPPMLVQEPGHGRARRERYPHLAGRGGELPGDERRMEIAVLRREEDRAGPGGAEVRRAPLGLVSGQELHLDAEGLGERRVPAHARLSLRAQDHPHRADAVEPKGAPRHALEGRQRLDRLVDELHHELGSGDLGREPGGPGGGLRSKLVAVEQDDVPDPSAGQVVGGAGAESAGSDDDDLSSIAHGLPLRFSAPPILGPDPGSRAAHRCMLESADHGVKPPALALR